MTKRRTTQMLAELKELAQQAKENIYRRAQLATEVLNDLDWVAATYDGNLDQATETIEQEYFADVISSGISLGTIIDLYKHVSKEEWEECRYNLAAVQIVYEGRYQKDKVRLPSNKWKKQYHELLEKYEAMIDELASWKQIAKERETTIQTLQDQISELKATVAKLEGQIEELRRQPA